MPRGCDIEGCLEPHEAKGLCTRHYSQKRRGKEPTLASPGCFFCSPGTGTHPLCGACRNELAGMRAYLRDRCSSLAPIT